MGKEGFYTGPNVNSFRSREQIMAKAALNAVKENNVTLLTPFSNPRPGFTESVQDLIDAQKTIEKYRNVPEHVEIKIDTDKPIALIPFGDIHAGGIDVDYEKFYKEAVGVAEAPGTYVMTMGDLTDSYWWGKSAQDKQLAGFEQQNHVLRQTLKLFAGQKKLLASWLGDHDGWSSQMGETAYAEYGETYGAYYLEGVSYITLHVGEQTYKISGCHRHSGFSIYNKAHPAIRLRMDESEGSDINVTAHYHRKAYLAQPTKRFGGESDLAHYISIGAYKRSDDYGKKLGMGRLNKEELGPPAILLWPDRKQVEVVWDVGRGLEMLDLVRG